MRQSPAAFEPSPLTPRQQAILTYIRSLPVPPSFREIGSHFGYASTNSVTCHLRALEQKGALTVTRGVKRGIVVPKPKPVLPCRGIVR